MTRGWGKGEKRKFVLDKAEITDKRNGKKQGKAFRLPKSPSNRSRAEKKVSEILKRYLK